MFSPDVFTLLLPTWRRIRRRCRAERRPVRRGALKVIQPREVSTRQSAVSRVALGDRRQGILAREDRCHIANREIGHEALRHALGRGHQAALVETCTDVAVVAGDKPACVQTTPDFDNLGANLFFGSSTQIGTAFAQCKLQSHRDRANLSSKTELCVSGPLWPVITEIDIRVGIFRSRSSFSHPRSLNRATRTCRKPDRAQV